MQKLKIILLGLLFLIDSCQLPDYCLFPSARRGEGRNEETSRLEKDDEGGDPVWVTAVEMSGNYDWRKDSSYYCPSGRIILYRDFKEYLSVPVGNSYRTSAAADMHHFIQGHLYTEYCDASSTYISRDGDKAVSYPGRERLVGLMEEGGDIFTLGLKLDGSGFTYRRNGVVMFEKQKASVFGDFYDTSYADTGALYMSGSSLCFCYFTTNLGTRKFYMCSDDISYDVDVAYELQDVDDMKVINGESYILSYLNSKYVLLLNRGKKTLVSESYSWHQGRLLDVDGKVCVTGISKKTQGGVPVTWFWDGTTLVSASGKEEDFIYNDGGNLAFVCASSDGIVQWHLSNGATNNSAKRNFFFNSRCASFKNGDLLIALTPHEKEFPSVKSENGEVTLPINGYVTGIYRNVNPPRK